MRYYIALGRTLCTLIKNNACKYMPGVITSCNGDIIAYNPKEDSFKEFIDSITGWEKIMILTSEQLDEIEKYVEIDRAKFKIGDEMLPIEILSNFINSESIKKLISKKILTC